MIIITIGKHNVKLSGQLEAGQSLCGWIISLQMVTLAIMAIDDHTYSIQSTKTMNIYDCVNIINIDTHHLQAYDQPT